MYFVKNVTYFPFNSWLSFQRLCRLLWGYHFHFVDSTVPNFVKIGKDRRSSNRVDGQTEVAGGVDGSKGVERVRDATRRDPVEQHPRT